MTISEITKYFFGIFTGRIGVKNWILGILFLNIIGFFLGIFAVIALSSIKLFFLLVMLASIPLSIICLSLSVRRLHDKGKSGWLVLLFLVPIINFFFSLYLLTKGEKEANAYGNPVQKDVDFFEDIFRLSKLLKKSK